MFGQKARFELIMLIGHTLSNVLIGVSESSSGILGLDRSSAVLKTFLEQRPSYLSNIFSFAFKDDSTADGENLFSLGRYAPSDIMRLPHRGGKEKDDSFRIRVPFVIFKNKKWFFPKEYTAVGSSYGILPGKILSKVFANESGFKNYSLLNEGGVVRHYFYIRGRTSPSYDGSK
jgi:hypothetical protein